MGMYTEIYVRASLKSNAPRDVVESLRMMFDPSLDFEPEELIEGLSFLGPRGWLIGRCCSFYHQPSSFSRMWQDGVLNNWYILSRSDIKNYDGEIEKFFQWAMPYFEPGFVGYSLYEEEDYPKIYVKKGFPEINDY